MTKKIGKVFSIVKQNAPMENATITNTVYDQNGYQITYYSLGANTNVIPERNVQQELVVVLQGTLYISLRTHQGRRDIEVREGHGYLRPPMTLCGYDAHEEPCVIREVTLHNDSVLSKKLTETEVFDFKNLIHFEPGMISQAHLLCDRQLTFNMYAISERKEGSQEIIRNTLVGVQQGRAEIRSEGRTCVLEKGEYLFLLANAKCDYAISMNTIISILEEEN